MGGAGGSIKTCQDARNNPEQTPADAPEDGKPLDETKQPPTAEPSIPDTTTSSRIPSFNEAFAASQTIEKLKAQKTPLSLEQQQELDNAEKIFTRRTEANILAQKATLEKRCEKIHPTTAAALAKAQATLARPAPRDRGPLPTIPDARKTIQDLSSKAAAGTLNADEAHQMAHAPRVITQQRVNDLAAAEANGTLTPAQKRQLDRFREILAASPYSTELPKGPPPGYDPHAANPAHREWHPPQGDKPDHPTADKFTPEALALPDNEITTTTERLKAEGHAHDRHGPEVAEGQLADRSMHGIDPISQTREDGVKRGQDHSYSGNATQFTSDRAMVQSLKAVEGSHEFLLKLQAAKAYNSTHASPKPQIKVLGVSLRDALGPNYKEHVRGSTREGSANAPTGNHPTDLTDGSIVAIYRYNPATGEYQLHTMYPNPK